jgi:hypothetical protein
MPTPLMCGALPGASARDATESILKLEEYKSSALFILYSTQPGELSVGIQK